MHNLAVSILDQDRLAEAEALFEQAYQGRRRVLGAGHLNTLASLLALAVVKTLKKDYSSAAQAYCELVEFCSLTYGSEHPETRRAGTNLLYNNAAWLEKLAAQDSQATAGELEQVQEATRRAAEIQPDSDGHLANSTVASMLDHHWSLAVETFEKAEKLSEAGLSPQCQIEMAKAYWHIREEQDALRVYANAAANIARKRDLPREKLVPILVSVEQLMSIEPNERERLVAEYYSQTDEAAPRALSERGQWHHVEGRHAEAVDDFTKAIQLQPEAVTAGQWRTRGISNSALEQYENAIEDFTRALDADANEEGKSWTLFERAEVYRRLGKFELALEDSSQSIPLRPSPDKARRHYLQRANIYRDLEDYESELSDCQKSIEIDSEQDGFLVTVHGVKTGRALM